jgi:lincosamide nucleotidyltransferase A/C/D/E
VLEVLELLRGAGIDARLDGGWGIDALLGRQTRPHRDLDLVVRLEDVDAAQAALARAGFVHAAGAQPGRPSRVVLRDPRGRQVDLHPVTVDICGDGWQSLDDGRHGHYPAGGLEGEGVVAGRTVRCITPELQRAHHRGYRLLDHERRDLDLLADRFGLQ